LSYKRNYVDRICQVSDTEIITFWDDGSVLLLDDEALLRSNNYSGVWLKHPFIGQVYIIAVDIKEDSTFVILEKDCCRVSFSRVNRNKACIDVIRAKKLEIGFAYKLLKMDGEIYVCKFSDSSLESVEKLDILD